MATVREGRRSALLLVDLQVGVTRDAWQAEAVCARAADAVIRARAAGVPVIWVQHGSDALVPGSADWQWTDPLRPGEDEARIDKRYNSAFEDTPLEALFAQLGTTHLVLAGAQTNWCIRATAYGALERGYDLTLLSDAHTTADMVLDDGARVTAEGIVRDLNIAMRWLEYPGRRTAASAAAALDFAAIDRVAAEAA